MKTTKRILVLFFLFVDFFFLKVSAQQIPQEKTVENKVFHTIQPGETLYRLTLIYKVPAKALLDANPGLKVENFQAGKVLLIPTSAKFNAENPVTENATYAYPELQTASSPLLPPVLKVAVILPFLETGSRTRMVEYYEGFLMAVDSLKRTGVSIDLHVYDSGGQKTSISPILKREEMKEMDIIFGPLYRQHVKPLADFAQTNKIRLVLPFTSKDNEVLTNPYIYQINVPQSYVYPEIYEHFIRWFGDANIIIIETGEQNVVRKKDEFINGLKQELQKKSSTVKTLNTGVIAGKMETLLSAEKNNILIPTSDSNTALFKLISQLTTVTANVRKGDIQANVQLFGYPEWQTYVKDHINNYFDFDTYFYSSFYTNNLMPDADKFAKDYRKWYSKETVVTYPRYGMLGYDTGLYFLKGLSLYGSELEDNLPNIRFTPLQMGFKFQRINNEGGFINRNVFFVHFSKEYEIRRISFDRLE